MRNTFFLLAVLLLAGSSTVGQVYLKSVDVAKTISYKSVSGDMIGQQMVTLLTSSFNGSANGFRIHADGTLHMEVVKQIDGKYVLQLAFRRRSFSGDNTYRGFQADSVLWPNLLKTQIQVFNGRHFRGEMDVFCLTDGSIQKWDVTAFISGRIGELSVRVNDAVFQYQEPQYEKLSRWVERVKTYYSFVKMLDNTEKRYRKYASDHQRTSVSIWIDRLELERMVWLLEEFDALKTMHISVSDPGDLMLLREKLIRYNHRAETLFEQTISQDKSLAENELMAFSRRYVELSTSYLLQSKKLQPADAIVPVKMASIQKGNRELSVIQSLIDSYGLKTSGFAWQIPQQINNQFIQASDRFMESEDFADALLLLYNASVIQAEFRLNPDKEFEDRFLHAFEGVTSSYLKVGRMAILTGNVSLSELYFQHALTMIDANQLVFQSMGSYDSVMPAFFSEVVQLCQLDDIQLAPEQKLAILDRVEPLVMKFGASWLPAFHQGYRNNSISVFRKKLLAFKQGMAEMQYPDAALALYEADEFYVEHAAYLAEETALMYQLSEELLEVYRSQSTELLKAGQPGTALEQLELAKKIRDWLPTYAVPQINSRMDSVVVPLIEDIISSVKFDIWALRLTNAEFKLHEVDSIEQRYLDGENPSILQLIRETRVELHDRSCLAAQQKLDVSVNEIMAALRNRSYKSAVKAMETASSLSNTNGNCQLDTFSYARAKQACEPVLKYLGEMNEVKFLLYSQGYNAAIDRYVELKNYALDNKLDTLGIDLPALYNFVGEQRLPLLTISTADYFSSRNQFLESLRYLWLAKDQKVNKNDLRSIMRRIAAGLAELDKSKEEPVEVTLEKYTANDQYFSYFKFVYRKNRLL